MSNQSLSIENLDSLYNLLEIGDIGDLCSDCCPCNDIYIFGGTSTILGAFEFLGWLGEDNLNVPCEPKIFWENCCSENCLDKLSEYAGDDFVELIQLQGVVEYSSLGNKSIFCMFYDYFKKNNTPPSEVVNEIERFLDAGIVVQCDRQNNKRVIANILQWISYSQVTGGSCEEGCSCRPETKCCMLYSGGVENYLLLAEFLNLIPSQIPL